MKQTKRKTAKRARRAIPRSADLDQLFDAIVVVLNRVAQDK